MTARSTLAILALATATARADPPREDGDSKALVATGALVMLGSYTASVNVAGMSDVHTAPYLYIPLAGPWLMLAEWPRCDATSPACDHSSNADAMLVADGALQLAGLAMAAYGMYESRARKPSALHIAPTHDGVLLYGRF
jgi:hypothetical protein